MTARATQDLSTFNLDFAGNTLGNVTVNGKPATAVRNGDELTVTPRRPLRRGQRFDVTVHYTADPTQQRHRDDAIETYGWIPTPGGTVVYPQPDGAKMIFPGNDHPSVKAPMTVNISAPQSLTALSNGELVRKKTHNGRTRWRYETGPVAGQLFQLAVGNYTLIDNGTHKGVRLQDAVPPELVEPTRQFRDLTRRHLDWLTARLGPYPYSTYGLLVADTDLGVALETQTLSLVPKADLTGTKVDAERNLVHELTHHWFGDDTNIKNWADLWISEGTARYFERVYSEENGGVTLESTMRDAYRQHDQWRHDTGAPAEPTNPTLFKRMRYDGSALVLYALRNEVGDRTFNRIEKTVAQLGRPTTTEQFITIASRTAGRDLKPFLTPWLYGPTTPPMPGHPDWTVDPVVTPQVTQ
jgi:aminopeptidase N